MLLSSPRARHRPPWAPEASLTSHLPSWRKMSTFVPMSPCQERAAPSAQDVGFYELAGAWDLWRVCVSCPHGLRELGGHQEPDVVATKHCQQLLGHFLEEAGKQSELHRQQLMHMGKPSCPHTPGPAVMLTRKDEPGQASIWGPQKMPGLVWNPRTANDTMGLLQPVSSSPRG